MTERVGLLPRHAGPGRVRGLIEATELPDPLDGNAYATGGVTPCPRALREAVDLWEPSRVARNDFGDAGRAHYLSYGREELRDSDRAVTDYERCRVSERG